jgi:hypothetical protein
MDLDCKLGQRFDRVLLEQDPPRFICCCTVVHCPDERECLEAFSADSPDRHVPPTPEQPIRQRRLSCISCLSEHATDFDLCAAANSRNKVLFELNFSEFQARHLDLRPSTNDENIQKEPAFVPC